MSETDAEFPRCVVYGEALPDFVRNEENTWVSAPGGSCRDVARVVGPPAPQAAWAGAGGGDCIGHEIIERSGSARLDARCIQQVLPLVAMVYQSDPPRYKFLGNGTADLAFEQAALPDGRKTACELARFCSISLVRDPLASRLDAIAAGLKQRGVRISYDPNYRDIMSDGFPLQFRHMARLADLIRSSDENLACIYPGCATDSALIDLRRLAQDALILFTRGRMASISTRPSGHFSSPPTNLASSLIPQEQATLASAHSSQACCSDPRAVMNTICGSRRQRPRLPVHKPGRTRRSAAKSTGFCIPMVSRSVPPALLADQPLNPRAR